MTTRTTPERVTAQRADRRRWAGLAVLSASLLLVVMDMTILNLALPAMAEDLRPSSVELLWIVDIYSLVLAGLLVTASSLGDRLGRRRMLITGFVIFGAASLGVLLADSPATVIAVRVLLGVGGAMIMPSTLSLIRALFPDARERATALGIWGATAAVGGALGPIVGGALLQNFSWHSAFLVNVPVMAAAVVAAFLLLPESRSERPGRLDPVATVLSIAGMVGLVYAIKQLGKHGVTAEVLLVGVLGAALLFAFVRRCLRAPEPMLEIRLFRGRGFTAGVLTALITSFAMVAALLLISQWLQLVQGWSALASGVALLPMAAGGLIGSPLAPALAQRIGARTVLVGGLAVGALGFLLLFVLPQPLTYAGIAASLTLIGIGTAPLAVASAVIMAGAPVDQAGSAAAIEESSYEIGAALGITILGSLAAAIYRAGLPGDAPTQARESLAGALTLGDPTLATTAQTAFTNSLTWFGLAGGLLLLAVAALVLHLTPRTLDLTATHH
ncbi:major facilitator superfamily MFS_1 [Kribbella flavida DSM 17836]|uniref:Major facilitator superfamily MFS_1 n=1 Tax=Kribbella flavida (strain DSM 17836 / JCM 10339 / NBRC 14399) TaxID=479435 RepID=D2PVG9_KRIFD|nr:MFS transporter [Kribbella flavida]ADB35209.1 major facilitator superfamily MFS_1 [Kribbella flavida DSM 17836]